MTSGTGPTLPALDVALKRRLETLREEGWALSDRFGRDRTEAGFHPFVPAEYGPVQEMLVRLRAPGLRFLEWGSAMGVITVMADLLGFTACGIELDDALVAIARDTAARHDSGATFVTGSFLPEGYRWRPRGGDGRTGTIGRGASGYLQLGHPLDDFDLVFAFPWGGEEAMMLDIMKCHGREDAILLLNTVNDGIMAYEGGRRRLRL